MKLFSRRNLILLVALAVLVAGLEAWRRLGDTVVQARVATVRMGNLVQTFRTNGVVEPVVFREIRAQGPATVVSVRIQEGEKVRAGESLAQLDDRDARSAAAEAQAQLYEAEQALGKVQSNESGAALSAQVSEAKADLDLAARTRDRDQHLLAEKAISQFDFDRTVAAFQKAADRLAALEKQKDQESKLQGLAGGAAQAKVSQARAALSNAEERLSATRVPAPIAGTVLAAPPAVGTLLSAGDLIAKVGDLEHLQVKAYIDQPDFSSIHTGSSVQITSTGFPGETWTGRVLSLSPQLTTVGKRIVGQAICSLDDGRDQPPVNSNVDMTFTSGEMRGVLLVPVDAVFQSNNRNAVYVVSGGRLHFREVEVGASNADSVIIRSGLQEGDTVLDDLEIQARDGMRIEPAGDPPQ
jgi:HlyD family secretion protein